jgi:hypothetical protein
MAFAQLGPLKWRVDPTEVSWNYQIDANRIETLGGQVVQILGATLGDVTVSGYFGQDRAHRQDSWQLAVAFHKRIQQIMDAQTLPPKKITVGRKSININAEKNVERIYDPKGPPPPPVAHQPLLFSYMDGVHNWQFKVLVKGIDDLDGNGSLHHTTGKFSYGYRLTLFVVEAQTDVIKKVATDSYIARISQGLGWKKTKYNGPVTAAEATAFIQSHGGSVTAFLTGVMTGGAA